MLTVREMKDVHLKLSNNFGDFNFETAVEEVWHKQQITSVTPWGKEK